MRAESANLNHCAVPFLSRAAAKLCWYYRTLAISISKNLSLKRSRLMDEEGGGFLWEVPNRLARSDNSFCPIESSGDTCKR